MTPKRERFCQAIVAGETQADAYRLAYGDKKPANVHSRASRLMSTPAVAQRVTELRQPVLEAAQTTLESHLNTLRELRDRAAASGNYAAAIAAEVARAKAYGIGKNKPEPLVMPRIILNLGGKEIDPATLGW